MLELTGSIHIHSVYSDGSRSIPEIVEFAKALNLDFLMFTDHNTLKPKYDGLEGIYDNVLTLIGYELNDKDDKNHYLIFNIDEEVKNTDSAADYIKEVREKGGIGIVAHPDENPPRLKSYFSDFPWTDWNIEGIKFIEIWNQMSEWKERMNHFNAVWHLMHPRKSLIGPEKITLERWDKLTQKGKVFAIGGVDAHSVRYRLFRIIPLRIYPYKVCFKTIRTHVWVDDVYKKYLMEKDFEKASELFYDAFDSGKMFISNYNIGNAAGFKYSVNNKNGHYISGEELFLDEETYIDINLPEKGRVKIIVDGSQLLEQENEFIRHKIENPGVYRIEVFQEDKPWIYSNPVWVKVRS